VRVLYVSEVQWLSQISRKHQIVRRLPAGWDVLFVSPVNACARENSFRLRSDTLYPHVRFRSLPLPKPDSRSAPLRALTGPLLAIGGARLRASARTFRPEAVVCSYIWAAPVMSSLAGSGVPVVYDCNDLHTEFYPARRKQAEIMFRDLVRVATEVVCSSSRLREICGRGAVIGNGVDLDLFSRRENAAIPRAIAESELGDCDDYVIYVGSVDDRVDFEMLGATADALVDSGRRVGLVCVGRVFDGARRSAEQLVEAHPGRVLFTGRVPYEELPDYLSHSSVGIAPFVMDERTRAINPNKLYMYAAMEQNVVSTPFSEEVSEHDGLVYLARDPASFAAAVKEALGDDVRRRAIRERVASPHSWKESARAFAELIESLASPDSRGT
jgi:teichuronic acid biosynthesis glycosyltransferase TuaH